MKEDVVAANLANLRQSINELKECIEKQNATVSKSEQSVKVDFDENYIKEAGEYTPGGFLASAFTNRSFGPTNEDLLWKLQYRIIRELAEKEPCVIVGRCADFILQDRTDCLKVFVHADLKFRADRIVRVYGEREKSPEARLKEKDKRRAAYYRFYTDMNWGNAANYHIALDSGVIGIEKCAKVIESLA